MRRMVLFALGLFVALSLSAEEKSAQPSLYKRLGGYDAIAAVSDDFLGRLVADKQLGRFLAGHSEDSVKKLRQNFVDFICAATGGPCYYVGRDMKTVHKGMGISEADWNQAVKLLVETLDKFKVPEKERGEVLSAISSLKKDVVER